MFTELGKREEGILISLVEKWQNSDKQCEEDDLVGDVDKDVLEDSSSQGHLVLWEEVTEPNSRESDKLKVEYVGEGEARGAVVVDGGDEEDDKQDREQNQTACRESRDESEMWVILTDEYQDYWITSHYYEGFSFFIRIFNCYILLIIQKYRVTGNLI